MKNTPIVRKIEDVSAVPVDNTQGASIQVLLGQDDDMPGFYTRLFTLETGGSIPAHRHETIEHEQVILEGEMVLTLEGRELTVGAGEVVYLPAKSAHAYENRGTIPVKFLCMVPATSDYTTEWL
ncbi:MAG: cupin domain-containing protein [Proteobacteria bacterium]|nr:cupin domain-containing protein [Pseudomonadota bacterium]